MNRLIAYVIVVAATFIALRAQDNNIIHNQRDACAAANASTRSNTRFLLKAVDGLAADAGPALPQDFRERLLALRPEIARRIEASADVDCDARYPEPSFP